MARARLAGSLAILAASLFAIAQPKAGLAQQTRPVAAERRAEPSSIAIEREFLEALFYLDGGQPEKAIPIFLSILAADPSLVRVRLELARAYFEAEQWGRSREEFFTVLSGDIPDPVRQRVLGYIQAIDARRGFDWDLTFSVTTAGNRRQYDTDEIELDFNGVVLPFELDRDLGSALAARISGSASYRLPFRFSADQPFDALAFVAVDFDIIEATGSRYDDYGLGARLGARMAWPTTTVTVAPFFTTQFLGGERVEDRLGLEASIERRNLFGGSVFAVASLAQKTSRISDDRSGHDAGALIGFRRSVGGRASVGASLALEDSRTDFDLENYREAEVRVFGSFDAPLGLTIRPSAYLGQRRFRTPSPLFTESPDEMSVGVQIVIEKSDVFFGDGFSPYASLQYERTTSDIDAFSFRERQIQIGLVRRF